MDDKDHLHYISLPRETLARQLFLGKHLGSKVHFQQHQLLYQDVEASGFLVVAVENHILDSLIFESLETRYFFYRFFSRIMIEKMKEKTVR